MRKLCTVLAIVCGFGGCAGVVRTQEAAKAASGKALDKVLPVRGFCIAAPGHRNVDEFVKFIDEELGPRSVNTLVLRVDYNYQFTSRPEMRDEGGLTKEDATKLSAACKRIGIRLIPQINLLGHQSWANHTGRLLQVHPEFDETPWVKNPEKYKWPNDDGLYCRSYCPLHPGVHEVVFALVDELCDAFEADAMHAGMDEVFYIGMENCPRCGGHDRAELFADEVAKIHAHLKKKNRQLWMWGDRLIDGKATGLGEWEASENGTAAAITKIPKDVVICDWHYDRPDPTAVLFAMNGLDVVTCPWQNSKVAVKQLHNVLGYREDATREMRPHYRGMMQTVWSGAEEFLREFNQGASDKKNAANCFRALFAEIDKLPKE